MNDFDKCYQYSLGAREKFDESILLKMLAPRAKTVHKTNANLDKKGVDYIVVFNDGSQVTVDAKTRMPGASKYWRHGEPELCLERYSVVELKKVGWLFKHGDVHPNYILYTFDEKDSKNVYLIPFTLLRSAGYKHGKNWAEKYGITKQANTSYGGYHSDAIFVPASVVIRAVSNEMMYAV